MKEGIKFWKEIEATILVITTTILIISIIHPTIAEGGSEGDIVLSFSFQEPLITEENISNITYHIVRMNETYPQYSIGYPLLPVKPLKILLPQKGVIESISITYSGNTSLGEGYNIQIGTDLNNSEIQNESGSDYNSSIPYPTEPYSNMGVFDFRGYTILVFNLHPIYYIGMTGEIYYYKNMTIIISTNQSGSISPLFRGLVSDETIMKQKVDDHSMNFTYTSVLDSMENSSIVNSSYSYDYVIITESNLANASPYPPDVREWYTFQDLANYKNLKGINTTIINISDIKSNPFYWNTTSQMFNDTQAQIRNFIIDAFKNWGIKYVLLGGHLVDENGAELIPTRFLWYNLGSSTARHKDSNLPSDFYYACLNGSFNGDYDEYWGEIGDGGHGGDFYEPKIHEGESYAEADSWGDYAYNFGTGLFTPALNLTGDANVTLKFDYIKNSDAYSNVTIFSGGLNASTSQFEETIWSKNTASSGTFEKEFNASNYYDPSKVYIQFNYTDLVNSTLASFNIDNVSCWLGDSCILTEGFEGNNFPPLNWTVKNYNISGNGASPLGNNDEGNFWRKEYYRVQVDLIADVYVGRALVKNSREVSNFVKKTLAYEKTDDHDPYLMDALMVGEFLYKEGGPYTWGGDLKDMIIDENTSEYNTTGIPSNKYNIDKLYDRDQKPIKLWLKPKLMKKLNKGYNIINLVAHGGTDRIGRPYYVGGKKYWYYSFKSEDAKDLVNKKFWFMYSMACNVGGFDKQNSLAENLINRGNGAFAVLMNSGPGFPSESSKLDRMFFDAVFNKSYMRLGNATYESKDIVSNDILGSISPLQRMRQCVYELNLLGDPTVAIRLPGENNTPPIKPDAPDVSSHLLSLYTFSISTTDPESDNVSYIWRVDGVNVSNWTKYYKSGEIAKKTLLIESGNHSIQVKARDIFWAESEWSNTTPVTVSFSSDIEIVTSPVVLGEEIQFYGETYQGASLPVSTWNYCFGDGNYSDQQNTKHTYGEIGTYNVTMTVTDAQNITSNVTKVVDVVILKSDINTSSDHGVPDGEISFHDLSNGYYNITSWSWDFGDGNTSNNRNTSHAYASEGIYNVSLNVTDGESNYNVSYQTIYIDTGDPEIESFSSDLNEIGYGYSINITANLSDLVSGVKTATINVTYPDNTTGNFSMNNTNGSIYEYVFNDTSQLGAYSYKVWVGDYAENLESSSQKEFTVIRSFGYRNIGNSNQSIWDTITGSKYKVNLKGVADNVSVYLDPGNATSDYHYQCAIYRHNDSKLMGISEEKNIFSGKGWKIFNFSVPKPVLINDTEYVLCCWSDNYTVKMYYNDSNEEEEYYNDGSSTLQGHYFEGVYNYTPEINNFDHETRRYSIYCKYTPDNSSPMIENISNTPGTVGFGFNVNITVNVTDNASGVATVKVNVTYPDDNYKNFTMNLTENNTYEYEFSDTWLVGQYNYSIWCVDYAGNSISSSGYSFNISAQATVSIATLKNSYEADEYINITDPPMPSDDYCLVGRGLTWNEYYNASSGKNIREIYTNPINYQDENGNWLPIEHNISVISSNHPAYNYGYRAGNEHGLYNVYFKPNAQDSWPIAFAYNKSTNPDTHVVRSKLIGVGYLDPSQNWAYEYLQNIQNGQGQISGNSAIYENVFTGTDVIWSYGNNGLKEEIIMDSTAKSALQEHPPSDYGLSNQDSYLVFITKLDYQNINLYNSSGILPGNFTASDGQIDFKDTVGELKCALPMGEAHEMNNISSRQDLTYRVIQYNGNYYLLSGLKVSDLNEMTFPVVIDPTLTVYSSNYDGEITSDSSSYSTAHDASEGLPYDFYPFITIGQKSETGGPPRYFIWRGFAYFDTSSIPSNDLIDSVTLSLYKEYDFSTTDFDIVIQNGQPTYPHSYLVPGDYNKNHYSGNGGYMNTASFSNGYNNITLTNFSWINTSGTTKLCIRSSRDINSNAPTGDEYVTVHSSEYPTGGSPKLVIEYRNQSKINNSGSTDIKGYLLMNIEYLNASSDWANDCVAIDDTTPRVINSSEELALDLIFNGLVNTDDLTHGDGTYRVYAAFRDPDGNILQTNDEKDMVSWYEFEVDK